MRAPIRWTWTAPDNTALRIISGWGDASQAMSYYFYAHPPTVSSAPFLQWAVDIPYL